MRPDVEDYAELDEGKQGPSSRAMSWMVLAVAVGGFAALAYYAYHSGSKATAEGETMVVEADQAPIKAAPDAPDGEQFPNKDKTIYDVITPAADGSSAKVEKLLPDPEHPVAAANVEDSEDDVPTVTPATAAAAPVAAPAPAPAKVAAAPAAAPAPAATTTTFVANTPANPAPAASAPQTVTEQPVATVAKPVPEKQPEVVKAPAKSYEAPKMINEKKPVAKKEEPAKPAAAKPAASGAYMVQLGAYASEAEAQGAWKKIASKFSLSGAPTIVKADVNGKTFYRLRTGSYASSADAKAECAKLAGQACMPVK